MNPLKGMRSSKRLPPLRFINAVVVLSRISARHRIDLTALLEKSDIDPEDLDDPMKRITLNQERQVALNLIERAPFPWIGLEVGKEYQFSANGKLGMAAMCCETLKEGLLLIMAYSPLTASCHHYVIEIKGKVGFARFHELIDLGKHRHFFCEAEIASLHAMSRVIINEKSVFRELHFRYPRPSYASKYEELFQCPVFFDAHGNKIVFDADLLNTPLSMANPLLKQALINDCNALIPLLEIHESVTERIRQELSIHKEGFPSVETLAKKIHLSSRTLRRRLLEERTSYNAIVADIRHKRAVDLLTTTRLSMEKVAAQLGFSEVSSFYRAFKTWTGQTPNTFRK